MKSRIKTPEFIALSACTMMLTALGIDIMLPAFAEIRIAFGLGDESTETARIISLFFLGQVTQIVFGALSDSWGRLAILRIGFPLYIVAGVAAAFASTLPWMLAARFAAGVGASAVFMTTIAGVRDRFAGDEMARIMSLVFTIFLFTPVLAPFLGIAILSVATWHWVFLTPPIFAVLICLWSLRLEESLPVAHRVPLSWKAIWHSISTVLGNRTFMKYTTITTLLFSALSSYVASSEHIIGVIYGRPQLFAWIFGGIGLFMSMASLLNSRLSAKYGARRSMKGLAVVYVIIGSLLVLVTLLNGDPPDMRLFFTGIAVMLALNLAIEPNSSALALEPMGEMAGMAAAIYGTIFFAVGSTLGSVVSEMLTDQVTPLVISFFVAGLIACVLTLRGESISHTSAAS